MIEPTSTAGDGVFLLSWRLSSRRCPIRLSSFVLLGIAIGFGSCAFKEASRVEPGTGGSFGAGTGGGGTGGRIYAGSGGAGPCSGLKCQLTTCVGAGCLVPACTGGATTTVTGKAYDPAGKVPLYNVSVYVPNRALATLAEGTACLRCEGSVSGEPLAQTVTDAAGNFKLDNVPVGADVPIVIQVGKWRRQSKIPMVTACTETKLTDPNITRLPRNQAEGHLPRIALTTGGLDALECLLRKIGIDDAEFTPETGTGRVNLYAGGNTNNMTGVGTMSYAPTLNAGAAFTRAPGWWDSVTNLLPYDLLLHSCEGTERPTNKSAAALQAFQDYANMGGRVFASHWHNYWLENPPTGPFRTVATFHHLNDPPSPFTSTIDTTFPKGQALADWLFNVGASTTAGSLIINGAKHTVDAVLPGAQRWIYSDAGATPSVQYLSFTTPLAVPDEEKCGKVVFSDLHVSSGSGAAGTDDQSKPNLPFPTGCVTTELSAQEKALEFMLFDLSACTPPGIP